MKRWKGENRETAPWIDPMTPNLSPLTFCLSAASVSPRARTEDEHRVDSNQQRCPLSPPSARGFGADLVIKFQIALHDDFGGENLRGALLGGGAEPSAEARIRDERDEGLD